MKIIYDIDGVIAEVPKDLSERLKSKPPAKVFTFWYYLTRKMVLKPTPGSILLTARPQSSRFVTKLWLALHGVFPSTYTLYMSNDTQEFKNIGIGLYTQRKIEKMNRLRLLILAYKGKVNSIYYVEDEEPLATAASTLCRSIVSVEEGHPKLKQPEGYYVLRLTYV